MLAGKIAVGQRLLNAVLDLLGSLLQLHGAQLDNDSLCLLAGFLFALLGVDRLEHFSYNFDLGFWHNRENVAIEMHRAALVFGVWEHLALGLQHPHAIDADEEHLLTKMVDATDKTIRYARKSHRPGSKHLLAENLLTKATMLMRSEPDRKKQIDKLIAEAEKIVFAETQPYAQVRCIYYMVKAWYATLIVPSFADTLAYLTKAEEISKRITPTDLDEIDNMIIPCADMMCIWERYSYSVEFLMDGIKICEQKETTVPYIRKKMELYRCLLDVCYEWGKQELCRSIIAEIDDGNRKYESIGIYVEIPEELRSLLFSDEPNN